MSNLSSVSREDNFDKAGN